MDSGLSDFKMGRHLIAHVASQAKSSTVHRGFAEYEYQRFYIHDASSRLALGRSVDKKIQALFGVLGLA
jgi:hypothetical protein